MTKKKGRNPSGKLPFSIGEFNRRALAEPGKCPVCESDDVESTPDHDGESNAHQNFSAKCGGCGQEWTEVYVLTQAFPKDA